MKEIYKIIDAYKYAFAGLRAAFGSERAFRQEVLLGAVLMPVSVFCDVSSVERVLLIGSFMLVLICELTNTAIEVAFNRISTEHHELTKKGKDIASTVVMLSFINMIMTWLIIFI